MLQRSSLSRYGRLSTSAVDCRLYGYRLSTSLGSRVPSGHRRLRLGGGLVAGAAPARRRAWTWACKAEVNAGPWPVTRLRRPGRVYGADAFGGGIRTRIAHGALTRNAPPPALQSGSPARPARVRCGTRGWSSAPALRWRNGVCESSTAPWREFCRPRFHCDPVDQSGSRQGRPVRYRPKRGSGRSASLCCRSKAPMGGGSVLSKPS